MKSTESKYVLVELDQAKPNFTNEWSQLILKSQQASLFHTTDFHRSFDQNFRYFKLCKGSQTKAGILCQVDKKDPRRMKPHPAMIHDGIFILDNFVDSNEKSRLNSAKYDIYQSAVEQLPQFFEEIKFSFVPEIIDIRPFQWHNYGLSNSSTYKISVRYTSFLDITVLKDDIELTQNQLFKGLSESRRQEIRYAIKNDVKVIESSDFSDFKRLYTEMSIKYDANAEKSANEIEVAFNNLVKNKAASLFYALNANGEIVAGALFGHKGDRSYYLYGVTEKSQRERYSGSFILWRAFQVLAQNYNIRSIDLEGINSPQRGWFKISFGGDINAYYNVSLNKKDLV